MNEDETSDSFTDDGSSQSKGETFDDDDIREVKYQYHSLPMRVFYLHLWPRLHYFWLHMMYIFICIVIGGAFIWKIEQGNATHASGGDRHLTYIDSALSAASAVSGAALGTLDFWSLRNGSKVVHLVLTQLGSVVFVGAMTAFIRRASLSRWLSKHPARKYRGSSDNLIVCHRALLCLGLALVAFNVACVLLTFLALVIYANTTLRSELHALDTNPTWFAFFNVVCGFNQAGFSLLREGLIPFNHNTFFVFVMCVNMLVSNAFLPLVMRIVLGACARRARDPAPWKFLLEHPRICSTILFPSMQTKMLAAFVSGLLLLQMVTFSLLDLNYPVLSDMNGWQRFLVTIFQSANILQAGYPVVEVSATNPGQQWCYFVYMLIAVYPYISTLRNSEVIAEGHDFFHPDSLIKQSERENRFERRMRDNSGVARANIVADASVHHLKKTFLGDAFWVIFAVFLICVFDGKSIETDSDFSMWKVIFELAGAYGGVGLTLGHPMANGGFSQIFSQSAKVVVIGVLILGRHRGMPRRKDVAVMQVQMLVKAPPQVGGDSQSTVDA